VLKINAKFILQLNVAYIKCITTIVPSAELSLAEIILLSMPLQEFSDEV
jgi:hypothetical protein